MYGFQLLAANNFADVIEKKHRSISIMNSLSLHPFYEDLALSLDQINALMEVLTYVNVSALKPTILMHYFNVTHGMICKAKSSCNNLSNVVMINTERNHIHQHG